MPRVKQAVRKNNKQETIDATLWLWAVSSPASFGEHRWRSPLGEHRNGSSAKPLAPTLFQAEHVLALLHPLNIETVADCYI